jgi:hypothetical protein
MGPEKMFEIDVCMKRLRRRKDRGGGEKTSSYQSNFFFVS